jgi:hypothetical protein
MEKNKKDRFSYDSDLGLKVVRSEKSVKEDDKKLKTKENDTDKPENKR